MCPNKTLPNISYNLIELLRLEQKKQKNDAHTNGLLFAYFTWK